MPSEGPRGNNAHRVHRSGEGGHAAGPSCCPWRPWAKGMASMSPVGQTSGHRAQVLGTTLTGLDKSKDRCAGAGRAGMEDDGVLVDRARNSTGDDGASPSPQT